MPDAQPHAPLTETLAGFVAGFDADDLPAEVLDWTRVCVRDTVGAMLAGSNPAYSTGRLIADFARDGGGKAVASVVGQGFKTGIVDAVLANGTMAFACDFEPTNPKALQHCIAVTVPTALAIGERMGASGKSFLAAVALGCEVAVRVSRALGPAEQYALGFHPSAVCGAFGGTATAGFLLGLDTEAMVRAFGLTGCQTSGLMAWESDPTENARPFQTGMAARNGVTAALLAEAGFGGPMAIFDHGHTIFHAFSRGAKPDLLIADLGENWDGVLDLKIKPYPSCAFLHSGIDATIGMVRDEDLKPGDIESLTMRFPRPGVHCIDDNPLRSHCAQYILSVAVVDRGLDVADIFVDRRLEDDEVAELGKRVTVIADDGEANARFPEYYATVIEVVTRDGRTFSRRNDVRRGNRAAPLSEDELLAKFTALASSVAPPERVSALLECLAGLAEASNVSELADLLG